MYQHFDVIDYELRMDGWHCTEFQDRFDECDACGAVAWITHYFYNPVDKGQEPRAYVEVVACQTCSSAKRFDREG